MSEIAQVQRRDIDEVTIVESKSRIVKLPRVHDLLSLQVELDAVINVTGTLTSVHAHAPAILLERLDILAGAKNVLYSAPFRFPVHANYPRSFHSEVTAPGTAIASYPIRAVGMIDFEGIDFLRSKDTAFQPYLLNLFQARLTFGSVAGLHTGGAASLTSGSIKLIAHELEERDDQKSEGKKFKKVTTQRETWTAANTNLKVDLPIGNTIRSVTVLATDDDAPSDTIVKRIQFAKNQTDIRHSTTWAQARSFNSADKQVQTPPGFVVIDGIHRGSLKTLIDLRDATAGQVILDVGAPAGAEGAVDIVVEEIIGF